MRTYWENQYGIHPRKKAPVTFVNAMNRADGPISLTVWWPSEGDSLQVVIEPEIFGQEP